MSKNKKFGETLLEHFNKVILKAPMSKKEEKATNERIKATLFGKKIPKKYQKSTPIKPKERILADTFYDYSEISESLSRIEMISILIKQYPAMPSWKKCGITKTQYLRYHYENFLNEIYIFKERVRLFLKHIERRCKRRSMIDDAKLVKKMNDVFEGALNDICDVRARHVHERRYKDEKIDQLEGLEIYSAYVDPQFDWFKNREYKALRMELSKQIIDIKKQLDGSLNVILEAIKHIIFKKLLKLQK